MNNMAMMTSMTASVDMGQLSPTTNERLQSLLQQPSPDILSPSSMTQSICSSGWLQNCEITYLIIDFFPKNKWYNPFSDLL